MVNMFTKAASFEMQVPATKTASFNTAGVNVDGYTGSNFLIYYGASGDTLSAGVNISCKLEESDTLGGVYTAVETPDVTYSTGTATNVFGLIDSPGEDSNMYEIGYVGSKDFVRVAVTFTGAHVYGTALSLWAKLGLPRALTTEAEPNP